MCLYNLWSEGLDKNLKTYGKDGFLYGSTNYSQFLPLLKLFTSTAEFNSELKKYILRTICTELLITVTIS